MSDTNAETGSGCQSMRCLMDHLLSGEEGPDRPGVADSTEGPERPSLPGAIAGPGHRGSPHGMGCTSGL